MADFLDTSGITYHLERLIKNANEKVVIISPYLRINDRIKELIEDKNRMKIRIDVVYGKNELQPDENNWLKSLDFVRTGFCKNLHAKCYLSEKEAIVTSMNLYEFSQQNNNEMGIYVSREDDSTLYEDINKEAIRLFRISEEIKVTVEKIPRNENVNNGKSKAAPKNKPKVAVKKNGFCIRCNDEIKLDPMSPYCKKCYTSWNKYKNEEYEEKHCHICGQATKSSKIKPTCYSCYKKNKNKLEFPL
ncbi:phospholipase D family protein [Methanolobus bombayensis]|uniref:phospholipase D family protein n=1 Tax=Methanolobus bombayensis TaxID=38023 RepID=UPI001AEA64A2|nr:phospholipase D family protein [Methanolobus bombayensis]MBP1909380.1 phosphatidylserine/phosphatidylglycerophosphate/cardiolipin synthase-like enzyme [Methanolobus bombayensis]